MPHDDLYGLAHTATYTITGVNGETGATVGTVNVSGTTHTNAGTYNDDPLELHRHRQLRGPERDGQRLHRQGGRDGGGTPYTCPTTTYTGLAHTATVHDHGVNGETGATVGTINVSGTTHTNAGTYTNDPWSFTGTANYNDIRTARSTTASPRPTRRWWSRRTPVPRRPIRALRTRRPTRSRV